MVHYVKNAEGKRVAAIVPIEEYDCEKKSDEWIAVRAGFMSVGAWQQARANMKIAQLKRVAEQLGVKVEQII